MTKRTAFKYVLLFAFILHSAAARTPAPVLSELPDGRGGTNVESVVYTDQMGFDKERSLNAFKDTVYPASRELLRMP
jgi:hypothetical protein